MSDAPPSDWLPKESSKGQAHTCVESSLLAPFLAHTASHRSYHGLRSLTHRFHTGHLLCCDDRFHTRNGRPLSCFALAVDQADASISHTVKTPPGVKLLTAIALLDLLTIGFSQWGHYPTAGLGHASFDQRGRVLSYGRQAVRQPSAKIAIRPVRAVLFFSTAW